MDINTISAILGDPADTLIIPTAGDDDVPSTLGPNAYTPTVLTIRDDTVLTFTRDVRGHTGANEDIPIYVSGGGAINMPLERFCGTLENRSIVPSDIPIVRRELLQEFFRALWVTLEARPQDAENIWAHPPSFTFTGEEFRASLELDMLPDHSQARDGSTDFHHRSKGKIMMGTAASAQKLYLKARAERGLVILMWSSSQSSSLYLTLAQHGTPYTRHRSRQYLADIHSRSQWRHHDERRGTD